VPKVWEKIKNENLPFIFFGSGFDVARSTMDDMMTVCVGIRMGDFFFKLTCSGCLCLL
jgi:hypothetical protein